MNDSTFPTPETWYAHRVSYGETDAMKQTYYGEYLHIFERARSQFIRERGMGYGDVEARGILLPVREASCRYRHPTHYDDLLQVRAGIEKWGGASMTFVYEVWNQDRTVLMTTGHTQHACVGPDGKPVRAPQWLKDLFTH